MDWRLVAEVRGPLHRSGSMLQGITGRPASANLPLRDGEDSFVAGAYDIRTFSN